MISTLEQHTGDVEDWKHYLVEKKKEFSEKYNTRIESTLSVRDFRILQTIGKGSYGTVVVGMRNEGEAYYALKIIEKSQIIKMNQVEQTQTEKRILFAVNFPFIITMAYYFKDAKYIYFVLPFINGGEMFTILRKHGKFDEKKSTFYAAQIVLAFEYLHYLDIIYRDLKPENILLDKSGYLKVTDLGFAKIVKKRTYTLCGTPDYLAPEIILSKGYSHSVDWWALGVLIFEMCCGIPPFYSKDVTQTYELIVNRNFRCPQRFSDPLKDIIDKFLQTDTSRRLGSLKSGVEEIKGHPWFKSISWLDILNKKVPAPLIPKIRSNADTTNFDTYEPIDLMIEGSDTLLDDF